MKGNRYHDDIITIGRIQLVKIAEKNREHHKSIYELRKNESLYWVQMGIYKIRYWRK